MAVATISSLTESYTSGVSEPIIFDEKDDVTFKVDGDVYQYDEQSDNKKEVRILYPKDEEAASSDGTEGSDEVLEVIG